MQKQDRHRSNFIRMTLLQMQIITKYLKSYISKSVNSGNSANISMHNDEYFHNKMTVPTFTMQHI